MKRPSPAPLPGRSEDRHHPVRVRDAAAVAGTLDESTEARPEPAVAPPADPGGVRRGAFGFERRGVVPAAIVAGVITFYAAGLPFVDALISPSGSYSSPGATAQLTPPPRQSSTGAVTPSGPSTEVKLVPASGCDPHSRVEVGQLTLERDGTTFHVRVHRVRRRRRSRRAAGRARGAA